jgi:hypothetical protein
MKEELNWPAIFDLRHSWNECLGKGTGQNKGIAQAATDVASEQKILRT